MEPPASEGSEGDAALVRSARAGDREAFAELVRRHEGWVRNMLCARLGTGEAQDAAQEAFLKAFSALGTLAEPAAFRGWLRTLAERTAVDLRRRRRGAALPEGAEGPPVVDEDLPEKEERRRAVARAVEALDDGYREVVVLRYDRGLSCGEIAAALGITPAAVSMRLMRAHEALSRPLAGWGGA